MEEGMATFCKPYGNRQILYDHADATEAQISWARMAADSSLAQVATVCARGGTRGIGQLAQPSVLWIAKRFRRIVASSVCRSLNDRSSEPTQINGTVPWDGGQGPNTNCSLAQRVISGNRQAGMKMRTVMASVWSIISGAWKRLTMMEELVTDASPADLMLAELRSGRLNLRRWIDVLRVPFCRQRQMLSWEPPGR
jgi:hypothetical protein